MPLRNKLLIALFVVLYLLIAVQMPSGEWDAFAIWNMRALYLYALPDPLAAFQVESLPHLDYPPLLPAIVALSWKLLGVAHPLVPITLHGMVYAALLSLIRQTWLLILVAGVGIVYAPHQYADLPLALALLVASVAYFRQKSLLVGVALGLGLLIKNEGSLIALAFIAAWILMERRIPWRALAGMAGQALLLILFKQLVPANDIMGSNGIFDRLLDVSRYRIILPEVTVGLLTFASGALPLFVLCVVLTRTRLRFSMPLLAVLFVWVGYVLVYAITPQDLTWHVWTSYDRLLLHLFPAFAVAATWAERRIAVPSPRPQRQAAPAPARDEVSVA